MPEPRLYPWKRPRGWWLRNPRYLLFQAREIGGILTAVYGLVLLYQLREFRRGEGAFEAFASLIGSPPIVLFTVVVFAFVLVHAVTWFAAFAKSQPGRPGRRVPWQKPFVGLIVLWGAVSLAVLFLFFGGL